MDVAITLRDYGASHLWVRDVEPAEPLLIEALRRIEAAMSEFHPDVIQCLYLLGQLYITKGDDARALSTMLEVLRRSREVFGETSINTIDALRQVGLLYCDRGDYEQAEQLLHSSRQAAFRQEFKENRESANARVGLGTCLLQQDRLEEAEAEFLTALVIIESMPGEGLLQLTRAKMGLVELYERKGDFDQAHALYVEVNQLLSPDMITQYVVEWQARLDEKTRQPN